MKIETIEQMKEYFRNSPCLASDMLYVSTKLRREWMLNHTRTIIGGSICEATFTNMGGGVWRAKVEV